MKAVVFVCLCVTVYACMSAARRFSEVLLLAAERRKKNIKREKNISSSNSSRLESTVGGKRNGESDWEIGLCVVWVGSP